MFLRLDNNAAGNVWFDDLSIYPANGFLSTYTYDPQAGMTSKIDSKGATVYFEYDDMLRLRTIRDQDRKIVKTYDYNYKQ